MTTYTPIDYASHAPSITEQSDAEKMACWRSNPTAVLSEAAAWDSQNEDQRRQMLVAYPKACFQGWDVTLTSDLQDA